MHVKSVMSLALHVSMCTMCEDEQMHRKSLPVPT